MEDCRARIETVKRESASKAERMEGPRRPPAPIMTTFWIQEAIFKLSEIS